MQLMTVNDWSKQSNRAKLNDLNDSHTPSQPFPMYSLASCNSAPSWSCPTRIEHQFPAKTSPSPSASFNNSNGSRPKAMLAGRSGQRRLALRELAAAASAFTSIAFYLAAPATLP